MNAFSRWFPTVIVAVFALYLGSKAMPPSDAPARFQVHQFARLPVQDEGRIKPFESMARETLLQLSGKQTWANAQLQERPAVEWVLAVMGRTPEAQSAKVFRIDHPELLTLLGLKQRTEPSAWRNRYALEEFEQQVPQVIQQAMALGSKPSGQHDAYDRAVMKLEQGIQSWFGLVRGRLPRVVPADPPATDWTTLADAVEQMQQIGTLAPAAQSLAMMLTAYGSGNVERFNQGVAEYHTAIEKQMPRDSLKARVEAWFGNFSPFYHGAVAYGMVMVLSLLGLLLIATPLGAPLRSAAFGLVVLAFVLHTVALIVRMYLQGRPPVTNLYASAIFIGWGALVIGLVLEVIYRVGLGTLVASAIGLATLIIAHNLAGGDDTMKMMEAVLDTNFWLATHVTTVTLGYTATYVAGFLGLLYILLGVCTPLLTKKLSELDPRMFGVYGGLEVGKLITQMTYGVICFALFLSFVGTVLGGIWADQSWGRFWGWDPKENGALLIVIWNALILHARWGGMAQQRGIACLSVFGNIITSWSWFGVNELGVGLHSYGFTDGVKGTLMVFMLSQLAIILVGMLPTHLWVSFRASSGVPKLKPGYQPVAAAAGGGKSRRGTSPTS